MRLSVTLGLLIFLGCFPGPALTAAGSGTMLVSPTSAASGSAGNIFTFFFTASETMSSGGITLSIPDGWTAPANNSDTPGYTTVTTDGIILADVFDSLDAVGGWSVGSACSGGLSIDGTLKHEGVGALSCINGNEGANNRWYANFVAEDWSGYTQIGFWIRTDTGIGRNQLRLAYDNNENLQSPIEQISFVADIAANTWTYVVLGLGPQPKTSVKSLGFVIRTPGELDNSNIHIDDIMLGPGEPNISGSAVSLRFLTADALGTATITYGAGGGVSGVTTPETSGNFTFMTSSRPSDGDVLLSIAAPPIVVVGGNAGSSYSTQTRRQTGTVNFSGLVFPGSRVTLLTHKSGTGIPIRQENFLVDGSYFNLHYDSLLPGVYTYGIQVEDKEKKVTPIKFYSVSVSPRSYRDILFFAPPTVTLEQNVIRQGDTLSFRGFVSQGSFIRVFVDDKERHGTVILDKDYKYFVTIPTEDLSYGSHALTVRQEQANGTVSDLSTRSIFSVSRLFAPRHDLNNDGSVNIEDWSIFLGLWHDVNATSTDRQKIDINRDGKIDISDFSVFIQTFHFYAP